ncbi:MAG: phage holin family protein [Candidatus Delongbacteria bacterium]|nr:phage holin family protein [Candidatus Delongbacteria bacterium]
MSTAFRAVFNTHTVQVNPVKISLLKFTPACYYVAKIEIGGFMRFVIYFFSLLVVIQIMPGIHSSSIWATIVAAFILGVLIALLKPLLILLTIPINILSLGLFTFIINGSLLYLTAWLVEGFEITGFWSAVFGSIIFSLVYIITNSMFKDKTSGN